MNHTLSIVFLFLLTSISSLTAQQLGVHRTNLAWLQDPARESAILDEINAPFERVVEHVDYCNQIGLPVLMMLAIENPAWFPPDRTIRKGTDLPFPDLGQLQDRLEALPQVRVASHPLHKGALHSNPLPTKGSTS